MSAKQDILDAVAAEKAQVNERLTAQDAKITELEAKLAGGGVITPEDLAEIKQAVADIFTPV